MKKGLLIGALYCAVFYLAAFAIPTTVDVNWDAFGSGVPLVVVFQNGDDSVGTLVTTGSHFAGTFYAEDKNDNPYNYGVDSGVFQTTATVDGGGFISFDVARTDSKASYGPAGQVSSSGVWTADGSAFLARQTTTNYASQKNCNYGFQSNDQYQASGSSYGIAHSVNSGDGDWAQISVFGSGAGVLTSMSDELGGTSFRLGNGCGCYHNSDFQATGSGSYEIMAVGANGLSGEGWSALGGGAYYESIVFNNGVIVEDIHVDGN